MCTLSVKAVSIPAKSDFSNWQSTSMKLAKEVTSMVAMIETSAKETRSLSGFQVAS